MDEQPHPGFGTWVQAVFIRAWLVAAGCFIGGLLLLKNGFQALGWTLAIGFGVSVIGTLGYLFHRIYHVPCPRCGQETRTLKDLPKGRMVAICDRCRVTWDLGLRLGIGQ